MSDSRASTNRSTAARARGLDSGAHEALVTALRPEGVAVKIAGHRERVARVALRGYTPRVGDRVLALAGANDAGLFIVGELFAPSADAAPRAEHTEREPTLRTTSGASATLEAGERLVLRDREGRVVVVFDAAQGTAEVSAPAGNLVLRAPSGGVRLEAATDLALHGARSATVSAGEGARVALEREGALRVEAARTHLASEQLEARVGRATVVAERIVTTAEALAQSVGRFELRARTLSERVETARRDVEGLLTERVGRVRTTVRESFDLLARRARVVAREDAVLDGKRVLLG